MTILKIFGILMVAVIIATAGSELGEKFSITGIQNIVPTAEAKIGRPLTPVSIAGVARRTARRCRRGVYNCKLPQTNIMDRQIAMTGHFVPASAEPSI
jgi:hypothetical protein